MVALTVGYVSGIIAAGIYAVQFFIPTATTLILAGLLREDATAATWSVVARAFHSSHWPVLLNSDSQVNVGISQVANIESWVRPLTLGVVSIAAIVTPLGLYETVVPADKPVQQAFNYAPDPSPMGFGTPPRSDLGFNRLCGFSTFTTCPSSNVVTNSTYEDGVLTVDYPYGYDNSIPQNLTETFQSGLENMDKTVSSIFDIENRSYKNHVDQDINNGSRHVVGAFRQIETLALKDDIRPIEGLIVDTKNGGIGFRNHTIPEPLTYGVKWSEDLLFIEPETQCVDTNLTLDFTISALLEASDLMLTDRGGFANLNHTYPEVNQKDTQANPDLQARAYKAAWVNNAMAMFFLNISNPAEPYPEPFMYVDSVVGKQISLPKPVRMDPYYDALVTSIAWGSFLNTPYSTGTLARSVDPPNQKRQMDPKGSLNQKGTSKPTKASNQEDGPNSKGTLKPTKTSNSEPTSQSEGLFTSSDSNPGPKKYPNPFNVSEKNFTIAQSFCQGATGFAHANISNIGVTCGMIFGAARRQDGSKSLIFDIGTNWTVPLYSCASAAKATIKTVDFQYNGTNGFNGLEVLGVRAKTYESEDQKPLWGVERTEMNLQDGSPLWGLVSDRYQGRTDISVLQKEELWLPGYTGMGTTPVATSENLPGTTFHTNALTAVYNLLPDSKSPLVFDYSGRSNLAMYAKWQEWSREAPTTSKILNLIWTDITANSVVGTRGWVQNRAPTGLEKRENGDGSNADAEARVSVSTFERRVRYELPFATPAIIVIVATLIIAVATTALFLFGKARPEVMRKFLFHTSVGRVMASYVYPGQCHPQTPTREWLKLTGRNRIDVSGYAPQGMGPMMMPNNTTTTFDAPLLNNGFPPPQAPYPPPGQPVPPHPTYPLATWRGKNEPD